MRQGDVFWVVGPDRSGRRPAVILTRSSAIGDLAAVTVAHVTTTIRGAPTEVILTQADGTPESCVVNLDTIHSVRKTRIGAVIAHLSPPRMREVKAGIEFALGFSEIG